VHGANFGIRGDSYLSLGGWPPLVTGEDTELGRRAARAGHLRISRTASIPVVTSVRQDGRAPAASPATCARSASRPHRRGHDGCDTRARQPDRCSGTAEAEWRAWPGLARLPGLDVTAWSSAVIIAAHEVLGPGGIIATLAAAGARVRVVAVTDGEASHGDRGNPAALTRRRAAEREAALHALGAGDTEIIRLGLPDAALDGRDAEIAAALDGLVTGFDACLAPWEHDAHADHEAVGRAAAQVSQQVTGGHGSTRSGYGTGPANAPARPVAARRPGAAAPGGGWPQACGHYPLLQPAATPSWRHGTRPAGRVRASFSAGL
jgi:hypothetical protein